MPFFDFLKSLFRPKPIIRDVSGLTSEAVGTSAATRQEEIGTGDELFKPDHRRKVLRDSRLFPKERVRTNVWRGGRKPKILPRQEADRLFSDSLRTRDRNIRDLLADVEQLRRLGLPEWKSEEDVAKALGLTIGQLRHYSIHRQREKTAHYVTFAVRKRSGGQRLIYAPKRRLKAIQRTLNKLLLGQLPVSPYAHGFRKNRSVATNAAPHVQKSVVIKLDITDCFPTIHFGRVRGLLIAYGYSYPVAQTLSVLMTESPRQPVEVEGQLYYVPIGPRVCVQGAPTSPALCNAVLRRLDYRLAGLAKKHGFDFTRYADDLTFSGQDASKIKLLITIAARIAWEEGLPLNRRKTRVLRSSQRQTVTGVVVNQSAGLSRSVRRRLRAALHQQRVSPSPDSGQRRILEGKLAYLRMLNSDQADALLARPKQS